MTLLAGAARCDITPEPGIPLMGYAARRGPSRGVHDQLFARALALAPAPQEGSGMVLVAADLCLMTPQQALEVRQRIAAGSGLPAPHIVVCCTHTHSGPEMGLRDLAKGRKAPDHVPKILSGLVEAGLAAHAARRPARLGWSRCSVRIGRNRRLQDGPVDPELLVLRLEGLDARPIGLLFQHACHPTVLGHENLELSADWPGAAASRIERETGAPALFVLGAHGDIDPRTRGVKDLIRRDQSRGRGFDAVEALGAEVAEAVLAGRADERGLTGPLGSASRKLRLPLHLGQLSAADAERELERRKQQLADRLDIHVKQLPRLSELESFVRDSIEGRPEPEARACIGLLRSYVRDKTAPFFARGRRQLHLEVTLIRIGDGALLALPLEATVEVGLDWKARVARRGLRGGLVSIANGWLRYLPHPRDLAHPRAHLHYEVLSSLLAPGACEKLLATGERLLDGLLES